MSITYKYLGGLGLASALTFTVGASPLVMTFDLLAADYSDYSTYTENGLTLASTGGSSQRFYATGVIGDTTATIYQSDGNPQQLTYSGGNFSLVSVDFTDLSGASALVTSSTGGSEVVSTAGTATFGSGFANASWVRFTFGTTTGTDPNYTINNVRVSPVPEPSEWVALSGMALVGWAILRRRNS